MSSSKNLLISMSCLTRNTSIFLMNSASNYAKWGMYAEAVKHYHKALNIEKTDENLWFNLGRALCEGGMLAKGKAALQRALQINPELMEAKVLIAALEKRGL